MGAILLILLAGAGAPLGLAAREATPPLRGTRKGIRRRTACPPLMATSCPPLDLIPLSWTAPRVMLGVTALPVAVDPI